MAENKSYKTIREKTGRERRNNTVNYIGMQMWWAPLIRRSDESFWKIIIVIDCIIWTHDILINGLRLVNVIFSLVGHCTRQWQQQHEANEDNNKTKKNVNCNRLINERTCTFCKSKSKSMKRLDWVLCKQKPKTKHKKCDRKTRFGYFRAIRTNQPNIGQSRKMWEWLHLTRQKKFLYIFNNYNFWAFSSSLTLRANHSIRVIRLNRNFDQPKTSSDTQQWRYIHVKRVNDASIFVAVI